MILNPRFMKRLELEENEFKSNPSIMCAPLKDNVLEWHFTIAGQKGSPFEGGFYHGAIYLSEKYPFTAPDIMFLTVNLSAKWKIFDKSADLCDRNLFLF